MNKVANIAKNTSYLTFALILQKVISFSYFTILARNLAPEQLGKYYFAISFTTIFSILIDLGLMNMLTREVAKNQLEANKLMGNVMTIKLLLAFVAILATFGLINISSHDPLVKDLVYLAAISMVLDSFTSTFYAVIRGFHNLIYESISSILIQLISLTFGVIALKFGLSLRWVITAMVLASIFNFIYSFCIIRLKFKIKLLPSYDKSFIVKMITITLPFGLFAIFQRIYTYLDSVLLSFLAGDRYVGLYQVAFKIIFALQFLPLAFTASLYPAMSAYWRDNKEQLAVSFERAMNYLIIISLPISIGIGVLADKIIVIFKEGYADAVIPLQISIMALFFIFINFPIGSLLNACDRQKINTINMAIVTIANVLLNLLLIPKYQAIGASISALGSNFLMFTLGIYWVPKIIKLNQKNIWKIFFKALAVSFLMGAGVWYLKNELNIFITVLIAGSAYFILLFALKGFKKEDIKSILQSFIKKTA